MLWGLIVLAAVLAAVVIVIYNGLVKRRQMALNGWSDITVQLKRRAELIPDLVQVVKGYARHERELFAEVTDRRARALSAGDDVRTRGMTEARLQTGEQRLLALAEAYPDMKSDTNFRDLQAELSETEEKIEMARRFYNGAVRELNTAVETFPGNLVASAFRIGTRDYFELDDPADAAVPDVEFDA